MVFFHSTKKGKKKKNGKTTIRITSIWYHTTRRQCVITPKNNLTLGLDSTIIGRTVMSFFISDIVEVVGRLGSVKSLKTISR